MSPHRLSIATLPSRIAGGSTGPLVDPAATTIGIVHFGIGAFHRSHQAVFTEDAAAATGDTGWGILGVTGRSDAVVQQLRPQDGLYGVLQKDAASTSLRVVGSVREVASPGRDSARVVEAVASPTTHIATLTITEKGYLRTSDGGIDTALPAVRHDIQLLEQELLGQDLLRAGLLGQDPTEASQTAIGLLARGLARRYRTGGEPFTVLCCDNVVHNGAMVKTVLLSLAAAVGAGDPDVAPQIVQARDGWLAWLGESIAYPSSMVDRITPAVTEADHDEALRLLGLRDDALVVAEPFSQWVIENTFAGPRPAWELAGVILTDDVAPFERAKLRILNSTHSLLAHLGILKGHRTIADAVADDALHRLVLSVLDDDILPTLSNLPGLDLVEYRDSVLARFANPALAHTTLQIAMDGSQKLPNRTLGTAVDRLATGALPNGLALVVAAWMLFIASTTEPGGPPLDDPLAEQLTAAVGTVSGLAADPVAAVDRLFALEAVFPPELRASTDFRSAVVSQLTEVRRITNQPTAPTSPPAPNG